MLPIEPGHTFSSLADFKEALRQWAIECNFTPHILDSDSHRVRAGCRSSPDCPFRIRANYNAKRGDARVTIVENVHTCGLTGQGPAHQNIKRAETGKMKFLMEAVPRLMTVTAETTIPNIIEVVERHYGQQIPKRQAQKVKGALVQRVKGPCRHCHRVGHTRRYCPQLRSTMPEQNPTFRHYEIPASQDAYNSNIRAERGDAESRGNHDDGYENEPMHNNFDGDTSMDYSNGQDEPPNMYHQSPQQLEIRAQTIEYPNGQEAPPETPQQQSRPHPRTDFPGILLEAVSEHNERRLPHPVYETPVPPHLNAMRLSTITNAVVEPSLMSSDASRSAPEIAGTRSDSPGVQPDAAKPASPPAVLTPAQKRKEASRLMKQAQELMRQAVALNEEADDDP